VRPTLDDRHHGPEAPEHLRELAPDVAATEDDEVRGELPQLHDAVVVEPRDRRDAFDPRRVGATPDVDHDDVSTVARPRDLDLAIADEPGVVGDEAEPVAGRGEPPLEPLAPAADDGVLARHDGGEVHADGVGVDAEPPGRARDVRRPRARDHRLGRRAAVVDARPAHLCALHEEHLAPRFREALRERNPRLPGTEDDGVEAHDSPQGCRLPRSA